jgi:hypothetical protein
MTASPAIDSRLLVSLKPGDGNGEKNPIDPVEINEMDNTILFIR